MSEGNVDKAIELMEEVDRLFSDEVNTRVSCSLIIDTVRAYLDLMTAKRRVRKAYSNK